MSDLSNVRLLTHELRNYWRELVGDLNGSTLDIIQSNQGQDILGEMKKIHTKLALTSLTQDRSLLAITGLQGAGKTTLLKRLYQLDDRYLPENLSRGEKLPVLITESDVTEPEGMVCVSKYEKNKGMYFENVSIDADEFKRISMNPAIEHVWLELLVPKLHFRDSRKSIVLLPGFENEKDDRSQQLLEHILYLSTSSVVVFRKDTYARDTNEQMFQLVQNIYRNVKPIFVLSHGDVNPEQNENLQKQMKVDFGIDERESDRIIISGDKSFQVSWKDQLLDSIGKYGFLSDEGGRKQQEMLEGLFSDVMVQMGELEALFRMEEERQIVDSGDVYDQKISHRLTSDFERSYERMLSRLETDIEQHLRNRVAAARLNFNEFVKENTGFWDNLTSMFKADALEKQEKLESALKEAWISAGDTTPEHTIINVVTDYIVEYSEKLNPTPLKETKVAPLKVQPLKAVENSTELTSLHSLKPLASAKKVVQKEKLNSLERIDAFFDKKRNDIISLTREDFTTLTVMGAMLGRQTLVSKQLQELPENQIIQVESIPSKGDATESTFNNIEAFTGRVDQLQNITPQLLKAIPVVLGVDVAIDGEADLITHTTTALNSLGIAITAQKLLMIMGAGFAITYGINAVRQGVQHINQRQLELAQAGHQVLDQLPSMQTKAYIQSLRRMFERMGDQLYEVHSEKIGKFDQYGELEKVQYSIKRIKNTNSKLQRMIFSHATFAY